MNLLRRPSALALVLAASAAAAPVEIKLVTILPDGTSGHQRLLELRSAWQKAAPADVKLTVRAGSADGEVILVKQMRAGRINAALISAVGLAQIDRSVTALQIMPLMFRDWAEVDHVREKVRGDLEARLREKGFEVLFWADAGWVRYFSKEPALRPADFKAMKMFVWTGEPQQLAILRSLGYQPVGLETEQILPALTTGMINVVPVPPFLANALQYNQHAPHMIDLNWVPIVGAAVVRRDEWERIPAATRPTLLRAAEATGVTIRAKGREEDEAAIAAMKKRKLFVHTPPPEVLAEWRQLAEQVYPRIRGEMVPAELFDRVQAHLAEYRAAHAAANTAAPCLRGTRHRAEELLLAAVLAVMIGLPLVEIGLRQVSSGVPSAPDFLRHLVLLVGMLGGALAAREGRLLALATLPSLLGPRAQRAAGVVASGTTAAVAGVLACGSGQFVLQEKASASVLAYGIPLWAVQAVMPAGFAAIALRVVWRAGNSGRERLATVGCAAAAAVVGATAPVGVTLALLLAAAALGTPVFATIAGAALALFRSNHVPVASVAIDHYGLVTNPALPAIPLFTLAGYFMAEGGASRRLVRVFQSLSGWIRGGPAVATALVCAFFTAFTGGSGVTILALGGLLLPVLRAARFSERDALGLLTGAGSLGILLPPCLPVILYAIVAKVDINTMFLAGLIPGTLLIVLTAAWGLWAGRRAAGAPARFDFTEARAAVAAARWELGMPVVALVTLFSGWATPVEAAAVTAAYAFFVEVVVHRDLHPWRDGPRVMAEAGLLVGGILLILGVALGLTNYLIDAQVPDAAAEWSLANVKSRWLFLLGLNVVLILVGSVVEIYAAIVVITPLLVPIGLRLGLDPVHLGIIFLANMELGFLAPPMGLNLLLSSARLGRPIPEVARATLPLLGVMFVGVLLITYLPALTTWLPRLLASSRP